MGLRDASVLDCCGVCSVCSDLLELDVYGLLLLHWLHAQAALSSSWQWPSVAQCTAAQCRQHVAPAVSLSYCIVFLCNVRCTSFASALVLSGTAGPAWGSRSAMRFMLSMCQRSAGYSLVGSSMHLQANSAVLDLHISSCHVALPCGLAQCPPMPRSTCPAGGPCCPRT